MDCSHSLFFRNRNSGARTLNNGLRVGNNRFQQGQNVRFREVDAVSRPLPQEQARSSGRFRPAPAVAGRSNRIRNDFSFPPDVGSRRQRQDRDRGRRSGEMLALPEL